MARLGLAGGNINGDSSLLAGSTSLGSVPTTFSRNYQSTTQVLTDNSRPNTDNSVFMPAGNPPVPFPKVASATPAGADFLRL